MHQIMKQLLCTGYVFYSVKSIHLNVILEICCFSELKHMSPPPFSKI